MKIKVEELKYDNYASLSMRSHYYLRDDGKHVRHGFFESWHPNGQKRDQSNFKDGRVHGNATLWYSNGGLKSRGHYIDNKKDGLWEYWHPNTKLSARLLMDNGKIIEGKCYLFDGALVSCIKNGLGRCVFFNDQGRVSEDVVWDGKKIRKSIWYDNEQLREQVVSTVNDLLLSGKYFSPKGVQISEVIDSNGVYIESLEIECQGVVKISYSQGRCVNGVLQGSEPLDQCDIMS